MKAWSNSDTEKNCGFVPEKKLLVAVLQRAVTDLCAGDDELKNEALGWLNNDNFDDEEKPLTFRFICEALDFDCSSLRKAILSHAAIEAKGKTHNEFKIAI